MPDLEERVAALEELVLHPPQFVTFPSLLTAEEEARFREELEAAAKQFPQHEIRLLPAPPPLTPGQVRCLLRECVTVVKPGETLVICGRDWTPNQVREIQQWMDEVRRDGEIGFKVLAVIGDELGIAEPGPGGAGGDDQP